MQKKSNSFLLKIKIGKNQNHSIKEVLGVGEVTPFGILKQCMKLGKRKKRGFLLHCVDKNRPARGRWRHRFAWRRIEALFL